MKYIVVGYTAVNNPNQILKTTKRQVQCSEERSIFFFFLFCPIRFGSETAKNLPLDQEDLEVPLHPLDLQDPGGKEKGRDTLLNLCKTFHQSSQSCSAVQQMLSHRLDKRWGATFSQAESGRIVAIDTFVFASQQTNRRKEIIRHR